MDNIDELINIIKTLRSENGCPWDRKQTINSIRPQMVEECYEAVEAIENGDMENLKEELGDLLLSIVHISEIASERGLFDFSGVVCGLNEKLVTRHPHVFTDEKCQTPEDAQKSWDLAKKKEGRRSVKKETATPALIKAQNALNKYVRKEPDTDKLLNDINSINSGNLRDFDKKSALIGEILLELTRISQKNDIIAEIALTNVIDSYINRFEGYSNC